jgi:hypothetical protein
MFGPNCAVTYSYQETGGWWNRSMNGLEKSRAALSARAEKLFRQTSRVGYDACAATSLRMISWSWWGK